MCPPDKAVVIAERVQLVVVTGLGSASPLITLDGQPINPARIELAEALAMLGNRISASSTNRVQAAGFACAVLLRDKSDKGLLLATLTLKPGAHVLEVAGASTRLFRSMTTNLSDAPKGWLLFHPHPPAHDTSQPMDCQSCHEVRVAEAKSLLGRAKVPQTCQQCHGEVELRLIHSHIMEPLANCRMCHNPHGTSRPSLLINDQDKLCSQCHEAGHFR
jgi:predicted CXXCH cytochrome family protein